MDRGAKADVFVDPIDHTEFQVDAYTAGGKALIELEQFEAVDEVLLIQFFVGGFLGVPERIETERGAEEELVAVVATDRKRCFRDGATLFRRAALCHVPERNGAGVIVQRVGVDEIRIVAKVFVIPIEVLVADALRLLGEIIGEGVVEVEAFVEGTTVEVVDPVQPDTEVPAFPALTFVVLGQRLREDEAGVGDVEVVTTVVGSVAQEGGRCLTRVDRRSKGQLRATIDRHSRGVLGQAAEVAADSGERAAHRRESGRAGQAVLAVTERVEVGLGICTQGAEHCKEEEQTIHSRGLTG